MENEIIIGILTLLTIVIGFFGKKFSSKIILIKQWVDVIAAYMEAITPNSEGGITLSKNEKDKLLKELKEARETKW